MTEVAVTEVLGELLSPSHVGTYMTCHSQTGAQAPRLHLPANQRLSLSLRSPLRSRANNSFRFALTTTPPYPKQGKRLNTLLLLQL